MLEEPVWMMVSNKEKSTDGVAEVGQDQIVQGMWTMIWGLDFNL